jgi:hypothetical protein
MATSKHKRNKAYRPRTPRTDTMDIAKRHKCALTPTEVGEIIVPTRASLEALRTGHADEQDWANLCEAAGIALDLGDVGIFSDQGSVDLFTVMYKACGEIGRRCNRVGRLVATGPELTALANGVDHHELQLGYASADELVLAVNARKRKVRQARAGGIECISLNLGEAVPA